MTKKNNKNAFTLAEMMVVLLILSIVTAAILPIITTRSKVNPNSPWLYAANNSDIWYGGGTQGAAIGATSLGPNITKLLLNTADATQKDIIFQQGGVTTGSLLVDGLGNMALGLDSLKINTTGFRNNAIGLNSLGANKTGYYNNAIGYKSLAANDKGYYNNAIGSNSLAVNFDGNYNNAIGNNALSLNLSGEYNNAVGNDSLKNNTASNNNAFGNSALKNNTIGEHNTAFGDTALWFNSTGDANTAVGYATVPSNTTGTMNTAIGAYALNNTNTGSNNTAVGALNLQGNKTGSFNTSIGYSANQANFTASHTIALGDSSVAQSDSAIAIGSGAKANFNSSVAIGCNVATTNSNQIMLGAATYSVIIPGDLTVSGNTSLQSLTVLGRTVINDANGFWTTSDKRLKNVGGEFTDGLDKIRELKPYNFNFKKDKEKSPKVGVMAQDLKKVFPKAVTKGDDGFFIIRQEDMFYAMVNSIKQLDKIVQNVVGQIKEVVVMVHILELKNMELVKVDNLNSKKIKILESKNKELEKNNKLLDSRLSKLES